MESGRRKEVGQKGRGEERNLVVVLRPHRTNGDKSGPALGG